jgi:hypothetical protein
MGNTTDTMQNFDANGARCPHRGDRRLLHRGHEHR